jgi:uncharacterized protein YecT (DUF1311 family)
MKIKYYFSLVLLMFLMCGKTFAQTQAQMNQMADANYKKADKELNKVYKQLISLLDDEEKQLLIKAEREWLKYRDSHCAFESKQFEGGSMMPLINLSCLEECTKNRIRELKSSIKSRN